MWLNDSILVKSKFHVFFLTLAKTSSEEEDSEEESVKKQSQYEIVVPTIPELPSMDYSEFESHEVEKVVEAITARVFEYMYHR